MKLYFEGEKITLVIVSNWMRSKLHSAALTMKSNCGIIYSLAENEHFIISEKMHINRAERRGTMKNWKRTRSIYGRLARLKKKTKRKCISAESFRFRFSVSGKPPDANKRTFSLFLSIRQVESIPLTNWFGRKFFDSLRGVEYLIIIIVIISHAGEQKNIHSTFERGFDEYWAHKWIRKYSYVQCANSKKKKRAKL